MKCLWATILSQTRAGGPACLPFPLTLTRCIVLLISPPCRIQKRENQMPVSCCIQTTPPVTFETHGLIANSVPPTKWLNGVMQRKDEDVSVKHTRSSDVRTGEQMGGRALSRGAAAWASDDSILLLLPFVFSQPFPGPW